MKYIKVIIDNDENETYELRACKFLKWDYDEKRKILTIYEKSGSFRIERRFENVTGFELKTINKKKKRGIHYEDS